MSDIIVHKILICKTVTDYMKFCKSEKLSIDDMESKLLEWLESIGIDFSR